MSNGKINYRLKNEKLNLTYKKFHLNLQLILYERGQTKGSQGKGI